MDILSFSFSWERQTLTWARALGSWLACWEGKSKVGTVSDTSLWMCLTAAPYNSLHEHTYCYALWLHSMDLSGLVISNLVKSNYPKHPTSAHYIFDCGHKTDPSLSLFDLHGINTFFLFFFFHILNHYYQGNCVEFYILNMQGSHWKPF